MIRSKTKIVYYSIQLALAILGFGIYVFVLIIDRNVIITPYWINRNYFNFLEITSYIYTAIIILYVIFFIVS